jgi:hypothetical protein
LAVSCELFIAACLARRAGTTGHRGGTVEASVFRYPEITADNPAFAEHPGDPSCPEFPQKPDLPRKWDQRG